MVTDLSDPGRRDVVEKATLSRDLLAPVMTQLSTDSPGLACRCVLVRQLGFFRRPCHLRAAMAPFGDVEAVAVCRDMHNGVVVFKDPAGAAAALGMQYTKTPHAGLGLYSTVPPLYLGFPSCFIQPGLVEYCSNHRAMQIDQFSLYPPTPTPSEPTSGEASTMAVDPREKPPGTTEFVPFLESKLQGPRLGEDGHLWVDGFKFTYYEKGMQIDNASTRVVQVPSVLVL
ncbi:unnamed protein product [Urochloa decumbens]|uniref:RRM domain-containing protein n=1 Tax=Urochloa decumbens TaxID=240449 RepID=A0ABC9FY88_9POAL